MLYEYRGIKLEINNMQHENHYKCWNYRTTFKLSMSQRGTFKGNLKSSLNLMKIKAQQINVCQIQLNQQCEKCL